MKYIGNTTLFLRGIQKDNDRLKKVIQKINSQPKDSIIYFDILYNKHEKQGSLYVNGIIYTDICDEQWIDCLKTLQDLLYDIKNIKISILYTDKFRKDFPRKIKNYNTADVWKRIHYGEIEYYTSCNSNRISKKTLKWENNNKEIVIKENKKIPDFITVDILKKGTWYILRKNK